MSAAYPRSIKHGHAKASGFSATYNTWRGMTDRCGNPNNTAYAHYGAKGIAVCHRWSDFSAFLADMGERPEGMTLDRIDGSKGYSKDNCRWASAKEQAENRKRCGPIPRLSGEDIALMCRIRAQGISWAEIGAQFGVHPAHASSLCRRAGVASAKVANRKQTPQRGERVPGSRLKESDVVAILASTESCIALGKKYGVSDTSVSFIRLGRTWKHVPRPDGYTYRGRAKL